MTSGRALLAAGAVLAAVLALTMSASSAAAGSAGAGAGTRSTTTATSTVRAAAGAVYNVDVTVRVAGHQRLRPRIQLTIAVNGVTEYDAPVHSQWCPQACVPVPVPGADAPVRILQLEPGGPPEVLLGLANGGAHCCFIDQVYSLGTTNRSVVRTEHDFLDVRPRPVDLRHDGHDELQSADARFLEAGFTDYAHSAAPIQVTAVSDGSFHDVTQRYPGLIGADASRWLAAFHRHVHNGRGDIAAWAADEDRLGREPLVARTLLHQLHAGHLDGPAGVSVAKAATFVAKLQRLLHRLGYQH